MRTALANNLVGKHSSKHVLDKSRTVRTLHLVLETVKKYVRKFVDIHLLGDVGWIAFIVFKGIAEVFGVIEFFFTLPQKQKHFLNLVEQVFFLEFRLKSWLFTTGDCRSETGHHEQLLDQRTHVASTAQVFNTNIASP